MGARTGADFVAGLADGRQVYINGRLIEDVSKYPPFAGPIRELAALYDLQHDSPSAAHVTYRSPSSGAPVGCSFLEVNEWPDVERRLNSDRLRCETVNGMMGRMPDFMNAFVTDFGAIECVLGRNEPAFGRNARRYYELCRERDLCLTHALVDPQVDRSKAVTAQEALRIVGENDRGLLVSGARMLATLAPITDEILIAPFANRRPEEAEYAVCFAVPVATPGLKILCRQPYDAGGSDFDRPLTTRYDESDALAVFENVLVPWERVFAARDTGTYNQIRVVLPGYLWLNSIVRAAAKLKFMTGLAGVIAEVVGRSELPRYREIVGELVANVELAEGLVVAGAHELLRNVKNLADNSAGAAAGHDASSAAIGGSYGTLNKGVVSLTAARIFFPPAHQKAVEAIRLLGSSGLIMTPTEADLDNPDVRPIIDRHLKGHEVSAAERVRVMKLAWDAISGDFGGRQLLYEWYYAGDPFNNRLLYFGSRRHRECNAMVCRALDSSLAPRKDASKSQ